MFNLNALMTYRNESCSYETDSHRTETDLTLRNLFTLAVVISLFGLWDRAHGDWSYEFEDNRVPEIWEVRPHPFVNSDSDTYSADASLGYLQVSESMSLEQGGTPVLLGIDTSETFADVRVSATVNLDPSVGTLMGLTTNTGGAGNGGYIFSVEFAPSADVGTAWLARAGGGVFDAAGSERDFGIPTRLEVDSSYFLELDVIGNQLTGRVFDTHGGDLLLSMTRTVANPVEGPKFAGVYSGTPNGFEDVPTGGTFDGISATALRPGDANLDGDVNFADFLTLSANFGQAGTWDQGDFDGNGMVQFPDFLALSDNFGTVANASVSTVPEPTGVSIALFGLLGLIRFQKRR